MPRIILLLLVLILGWSNHLELSVAGNLSDRLTNYPRWVTKPAVTFAQGDLVYPDWMAGNWTVTSTLIDLTAPLAPQITTPGFESNRLYLQKPIEFPVKFIEKAISRPINSAFLSTIISKPSIVADRSFNGLAISRAYLGNQAILSVKTDPDNPNRQITFFRGEGQLISTVIARNSETPSQNQFIATEISQQIFRGGTNTYLNEVETTTAYQLLSAKTIIADQVTAIYLSPKSPDYFQALNRPVALYRYRLELVKD
jgi:hypothetical protein